MDREDTPKRLHTQRRTKPNPQRTSTPDFEGPTQDYVKPTTTEQEESPCQGPEGRTRPTLEEGVERLRLVLRPVPPLPHHVQDEVPQK